MKSFSRLYSPRLLAYIPIGFTVAALSACGGSSSTPAATAAAPAAVAAPLANQLYAETNETANMVVHLSRAANGAIAIVDRTASGGMGLNGVKVGASAPGPDSLASQHSVILSSDKTMLFAVNAGDNSISAFSINQTTGSLTLANVTKTLGNTPTSLAYSNGYLYVTFNAGSDQIGAFQVAANGSLTQLGLYSLPMSGGAPTQVVVAPDNDFIVVSAGTANNSIVSYPINGNGSLGSPISSSTGINTPFAGAFLNGSGSTTYLSTDIADKSLASFAFSSSGTLAALSTQAAGVTAPCWLSVTPNNQFAYVGNGAGVISAYSIGAGGAVSVLNASAASEPQAIAGVNSVAADSWISADGLYLYSDYLGDDKIVSYSIGSTGALTKINQQVIGTATGLSLQGLVGI